MTRHVSAPGMVGFGKSALHTSIHVEDKIVLSMTSIVWTGSFGNMANDKVSMIKTIFWLRARRYFHHLYFHYISLTMVAMEMKLRMNKKGIRCEIYMVKPSG